MPSIKTIKAMTGGWPFEITAGRLGKAEDVQELFLHAVRSTWVSDTDQLRFFTLAVSVVRRSHLGKIASVGGAFTNSVRRRNKSESWCWGNSTDEQAAKAMLASLYALDPDPPPEVNTLAAAFSLDARASPVTSSKDDQIADLKRRFPQLARQT